MSDKKYIEILVVVNLLRPPNTDNRLRHLIQKCDEFASELRHYVLYHDTTEKKLKSEIYKTMEKRNIDLILCNYYEEWMRDIKKPIVVIERYDSCTLTNKNMQHLNKKNLVAIFKEYVCSNLADYNLPQHRNRVHYSNILKWYGDDITPMYSKPNDYSIELLQKIKPVSWNLYQYSFVCNSRMERAAYSQPPSNKDIDVFFVCNEHKEHPVLFKHRSEGQKKLSSEKLSNYKIVTKHINNRREYVNLVSRSKICVAPYGLGARIALDQLGLLYGCIVIKPTMTHVKVNPDIYTDEYFNFVADNWDNLVPEIARILENWDHWSVVGLERKNKIVKNFGVKYYVEEYKKNILNVLN